MLASFDNNRIPDRAISMVAEKLFVISFETSRLHGSISRYGLQP
jgi:hypothetical protein